jgi:phosphoglycolate phosphatase
MKFEAVIFDLDGTLLDTIEDIADSMNATLSRFGFPVHPKNKYLEFVGEGLDALVQKALPEEGRSSGVLARCIEDMRAEYAGRWSHTSRPYPGIPELLDALTGRGIKLSVLSNKADVFTKQMVEKLLNKWRFAEVRGLSVDCPRKPDPCGALLCAERMQVDPGSCIFLGDSGIDMETGTRAGMFPVGALWGYQNRSALQSHGAKVILEDPRDLMSCMEREFR